MTQEPSNDPLGDINIEAPKKFGSSKKISRTETENPNSYSSYKEKATKNPTISE
jgi:hypothetical protein